MILNNCFLFFQKIFKKNKKTNKNIDMIPDNESILNSPSLSSLYISPINSSMSTKYISPINSSMSTKYITPINSSMSTKYISPINSLNNIKIMSTNTSSCSLNTYYYYDEENNNLFVYKR